VKTFIVIVAVAVTSSNPGTIQVFKEQFPAFWKPDTSGPTPRPTIAEFHPAWVGLRPVGNLSNRH
jgi:hypothetical protein